MPYKSESMRRYFHAASARGEIKPSVVAEFDKSSKGLKLPEKVKRPTFSNLKMKLSK